VCSSNRLAVHRTRICTTIGRAFLFSLFCGPGHAAALNTPAMTGPLVANPSPFSFDAGSLGTLYVTGAATGLGVWQDNPVPGNGTWRADLGNGQIFIQRTDGWLQFFADVGGYSQPSLGTPYVSAGDAVEHSFGLLPQGYLKIVPTPTFSIEAGKLPTQIGEENSLTFQNVNIERGLLWNQTPSFTRGVQANYASGPLSVAISWNDGYYSNRLSWITGTASWSRNDNIDTLGIIGGANLAHTTYATFTAPLAQNNSAIGDISYTHIFGAWMIQPYIQLSHVPSNPEIGFPRGASTYSGAVLASYAFTGEFFLAGRAEYITTTGQDVPGTPNLLYGPGSNAWSLTLTPTFQRGIFFARADLSYVLAAEAAPGDGFGTRLDKSSQSRLMLESGVLF
jgi:Putative beta-barrel porin-2, OmpL-like. bbp2